MGMHYFRELKVWQRAMLLAELVYKEMADFPVEEKYGLRSQLRRSVVSIASNISEGAGRATNKQFRQFLEFSMGSCNEAQTQIELSYRLGYIQKGKADLLLDEALQLYKMLLTFYNTLKVD